MWQIDFSIREKQATVSRSSAESEYKSLASTIAEPTWIIGLISDLGVQVQLPVTELKTYLQEVGCNHAHQRVGFHNDGFATTPTMRKSHLIWVNARMHIKTYKYLVWYLPLLALVYAWYKAVATMNSIVYDVEQE
ncbi:hypothetical protein FXO38_28815 [Capsicum annuum]|uniref:Acyl-[acyl-carrier-protein] hydrolase n=1 Tax=Capsicum annuum TaxID=4072 RepID=A0A2G2YSV5_CAPAN|nr:hypothetical protein FXO38_28815 [Capsicum annuum]KAF3667241.1 hypothetical protein FXO37_10113 [Capsicum annuum]PHT72745.1 hypothetical protein T459_23530 [Capsicum annuum]